MARKGKVQECEKGQMTGDGGDMRVTAGQVGVAGSKIMW